MSNLTRFNVSIFAKVKIDANNIASASNSSAINSVKDRISNDSSILAGNDSDLGLQMTFVEYIDSLHTATSTGQILEQGLLEESIDMRQELQDSKTALQAALTSIPSTSETQAIRQQLQDQISNIDEIENRIIRKTT